MRASLIPYPAKIHRQADYHLMIDGASPDRKMLTGKIDGDLVRNLVFHTFEQRELAVSAGWPFV